MFIVWDGSSSPRLPALVHDRPSTWTLRDPALRYRVCPRPLGSRTRARALRFPRWRSFPQDFEHLESIFRSALDGRSGCSPWRIGTMLLETARRSSSSWGPTCDQRKKEGRSRAGSPRGTRGPGFCGWGTHGGVTFPVTHCAGAVAVRASEAYFMALAAAVPLGSSAYARTADAILFSSH
jgi:hypothetical protein